MAVPFDPAGGTVTGTAALVLEDVRREGAFGVPQLTVSDDGLLAYVPGTDMGISTPVWVDRQGTISEIPLPAARAFGLVLARLDQVVNGPEVVIARSFAG